MVLPSEGQTLPLLCCWSIGGGAQEEVELRAVPNALEALYVRP